MELALYKVLIVEDDYLVAEDIRTVCEEAHCLIVGPVRNEAEALLMLHNDVPDIAIVDLDLGDGVTTGVPKMLREQGIPFCFATGYDRNAIPVDYEDAPYLRKPVGKEDLLAMLKQVLG